MQKDKENNKKSKKITIDDLARMVAHGFSSMEERLDERFNKIDERFNKVDERFDQIDKRLDRMEKRHERRLDALENRTITLKNHIENGFKKKLAW